MVFLFFLCDSQLCNNLKDGETSTVAQQQIREGRQSRRVKGGMEYTKLVLKQSNHIFQGKMMCS